MSRRGSVDLDFLVGFYGGRGGRCRGSLLARLVRQGRLTQPLVLLGRRFLLRSFLSESEKTRGLQMEKR